MNITSAQFVKGILGSDPALGNGFPQVAFVGRSNAGKSSLINSLTRQKGLARTSNTPGRTREINLFLINDNSYFLDLPGYGYAKASKSAQAELGDLISAYLFDAPYLQKKIVVVIDAAVGPTIADLAMLSDLEEHRKNILVVANKFDKVKKTAQKKQLEVIQEKVGGHKVVAYSSKENIGRNELLGEIM
ncbi:MAG: ribosome biogenesis GTP-binding protein YihA/YsxC [Parcubacteria group bacterium]